jgi:rubrerythrin
MFIYSGNSGLINWRDLILNAKLLKLMRDDEKAHMDVDMNRRYLEAARKVGDNELKSLLTGLAFEEKEHQKRKVRLLRKTVNKVKKLNLAQ